MQEVAVRSPQDAAPYTSPLYPSYTTYRHEGGPRRASDGGDHSPMSPSKQSAYRTKPCRYDQAGYCRSGAACPFKHHPDADFRVVDPKTKTNTGDASRSLPESTRGMANSRILTAPSITYDLTEASCTVRPSISIPLTSHPVYPAYLCSPAWPSHIGHASSPLSDSSVASPVHTIPGHLPVSMVPTPFGGNPFDPNSHFISSPSESPDELVSPLEDFRLSEPFVRRQSYPLVTPNSAPSHYGPMTCPTAGYPGLPSHYIDRFGMSSPKTGGLSHHTRRSSSQSSRKLAASYKTKPCKFWGLDGSCPNGQACSFIHDEDLPGSLRAASQSSEDSTEIGSPSSAHSSQLPSDLPAKPLSVIEEKKKHGFYPISWRVIGGGVMVSGKREFCRSYAAGYCEKGDDCPFAHDSGSDVSPPSEPDLEEGYYDARPPYISHVEIPPKHRVDGKAKGTRPVSITIPPATNFLPASEASNSGLPISNPGAGYDKKSGKGSTKSSASHRRTRSMSIPPTPGSPRLGGENLFPAESPGGL